MDKVTGIIDSCALQLLGCLVLCSKFYVTIWFPTLREATKDNDGRSDGGGELPIEDVLSEKNKKCPWERGARKQVPVKTKAKVQ